MVIVPQIYKAFPKFFAAKFYTEKSHKTFIVLKI